MAAASASFVADQQNWQQRVKAENEAPTLWHKNWGELYGAGSGDRKQQIADLKAKLEKMEKTTMLTQSSTYGYGTPFTEIMVNKTVQLKSLDD